MGDGLQNVMRLWLKNTTMRSADRRTASICVRGVDEDLWRVFKAAAILHGLTLAEAVEEGIVLHLRLRQQGGQASR